MASVANAATLHVLENSLRRHVQIISAADNLIIVIGSDGLLEVLKNMLPQKGLASLRSAMTRAMADIHDDNKMKDGSMKVDVIPLVLFVAGLRVGVDDFELITERIVQDFQTGQQDRHGIAAVLPHHPESGGASVRVLTHLEDAHAGVLRADEQGGLGQGHSDSRSRDQGLSARQL